MKDILRYCFRFSLMCLLIPAWIQAASYAYISKPKVYVKNKASSQGRNIAALKKGAKVAFRKTQGSWYLISYKTSSGQVKSGWVAKGSISKSRPRRTQARRTPVRRTPVKKPSSNRYASKPSRPATARRAPTQKRNSSSASSDSKIIAQLGVGASYYTYDVVSDTRAFAYSFLGPSAQLDLAYTAYEDNQSGIKASVILDGNFAFYASKTNLQDNTGTVFGERTQNNMAFHVIPGIQIEKSFSPQLRLGLFAGYRYFSFMGDDVVDVNGDPLGLYNSFTASGVVIGPTLSYKYSDSIMVNLAAKAILAQSYTEDPEGSSGTADSDAIGYIPSLEIRFTGGSNSMSLKYSFHRMQSSFTGDVNRVKQDFTNITATTDIQFIGLSYNKQF